MAWTAVQKFAKTAIRFISGIILARLLTPFDYGCIGMLAIFMTLAESFIAGGFGVALIQKKRPTQVDYSTIFYWNIAMSVAMYAILYTSAPAIARFYDIPLLSKVLRVQGLVLFIYALNLVQRNRLRKELNFRLLSIVSLTSSIIALAVTIWMAYKGYGVWALVAQNLVVSAIPTLVFWFYVKWRPSLVFSWKSFKELFSFGFYVFMTGLINSFCRRIQGLFIGKIYDVSTMGYYSKAQEAENMASNSISDIMAEVTYPLYAEVQDNKPALVNMIKRLTMTVSYVTFPILFLLMVCARPFFILLFSERWIASIPYFQVLCLAGIAVCLHSIQLQSIAAIGKSKVMFLAMLIKRAVGLSAILGGLFFFGIEGMLVGIVINSWFSYFYNACLVSKYIGYSFRRQMLDLLPIILASVLAAAAGHFIGGMFHLSLYADGVVKALILIVFYLGWSLLFKPEAYDYTRSVLVLYYNKLFHHDSSLSAKK